MMGCCDHETATSYLRGDLDPPEAASFAAHLASCLQCQGTLREVSELLDSVRRDLLTLAESPRGRTDWRRATLSTEPSAAGWPPGSPDLHPMARQLATGLLAALLIAALWLANGLLNPSVSAASLLQASVRAESARTPPAGFVAHRQYEITSRRLPSPSGVRQRMEVWHDPAGRVTARRLFDEQRRLLAGEWNNADGSRTLYERGGHPRLEGAGASKPLTPASAWRWEPSASAFATLASDRRQMKATSAGAGYVLALSPGAGSVAALELTIDEEHRPVRQRLLVRGLGGEVSEIISAKAAPDETVAGPASASAFRPDADLLPPLATPPSRPPAPAVAHAAAPAVGNLEPALDIDAVELLATYSVRRLSVCLAEPARWHVAGGLFHLTVTTMRSQDCRDKAGGLLARLADTPRVEVTLSVADAALDGGTFAADPPADRAAGDVDVAALPLYPALGDAYRPTRASEAEVLQSVHSFVTRIKSYSEQLSAHAADARQLCDRWSDDSLERMGPDPASLWAALMRDQARAAGDAARLMASEVLVLSGLSELPRALRERRSSQDVDSQAVLDEVGIQRARRLLNSRDELNLSGLRRLVTEVSAAASSVAASVLAITSPQTPGAPFPGDVKKDAEGIIRHLEEIAATTHIVATLPIGLER